MPRSKSKPMPKFMAESPSPVSTPRPARTTPPPRPSHTAGISGVRPANGTVRSCPPQRGELLRHRVMSADGRDVAVTTTKTAQGHVTGVYPVQNGYLVMIRQPLYEISSGSIEAAREQHDQLVRVLAELGVRVVRARRYREETGQPDESSEVAREAAATVVGRQVGATA